MLRRHRGYMGRRMLRLDVPGKRRRGKIKRKFIGVVRGDMRGDRCDRAGCTIQGETEKDVLPWQPLMGSAERKKRYSYMNTSLEWRYEKVDY